MAPRRALMVAIGLCVFAPAVRGQVPAAIVEDAGPEVTVVEFMDYLSPGQVIELPRNATLVLGYFRSCVRESVTGGQVTIGETESRVVGGRVARVIVACEPRTLTLGRQEVQRSGAMAFRAPPKKKEVRALAIFSRQPIIDGVRPGRLVIKQLDGAHADVEIDIGVSDLIKRRVYDFARAGRKLDADGLYEASQENSVAIFLVNSGTSADGRPVIGRLVRLVPSG